MVLDCIEENGIEVIFSYFPAWEMFFSMHVLACPDHHMGRRKWQQAVEEKNPGLTEEIRNLQNLTQGWTILIDIPAWDTFRQMEIPELLTFLRKKNIYEWNEMILPFGKRMSIEERDRVLGAAGEYYRLVFEREEMVLRPYISRVLREERQICIEKGVFGWCRRIHPRLIVREEDLTYRKNREYTFKKKDIRRIYASVSTFVTPHLWMYEEAQALDVVKGIQVERPGDEIPDDLVRVAYQGYLSDTEYIIYSDEPGVRDYVSDPVSSGESAACGADIPADACGQPVSECGDRTSELDGECGADPADCIAVRGISDDWDGVV